MFGLMKPKGCGTSPYSSTHRRLHYCGTCKSMGRLYGQRARLLLNNDAVFLAELLTAIGPERGSVTSWSRPLRSYNCASMPKSDAEMPLPLQYASASTIVMCEMKLQDRMTDRPVAGLKLIGRLYSEAFCRAAQQLKIWGLPVDQLWSWYMAQGDREHGIMAAASLRSPDEDLAYLAEPTAQVTGMVFKHGAVAIGADPDRQVAMFNLGCAFGSLIYLLDAFEDDRNDAKRGEFNALQSAYHQAGQPLSQANTERAGRAIQKGAIDVEEAISALPIPAAAANHYAERLAANVAERLGLSFASRCARAGGADCPPTSAKPRTSRRSTALSTAARLTAEHRAECSGVMHAAQAPFVFLSVFLAALVFPRQIMSAASYRECVGILFNLMFWGAAFNAMLALPQSLAPALGLANTGPWVRKIEPGIPHSSSTQHAHTTVVPTSRTRRRRGCCAGCDCDCCCDGCCDACDCACCTCEACECSSCACDSCSSCAS